MENESAYKVLLIEDSMGDMRLFEEAMQEINSIQISIDHSFRLSSGLDKIRKNKYDVILLDLGLPESCGLQTLQKALPEAKGIPIIVLTGTEDEELGFKAIQMGAQDYIIKYQLDPVLFVRSVRYAVERSRTPSIS